MGKDVCLRWVCWVHRVLRGEARAEILDFLKGVPQEMCFLVVCVVGMAVCPVFLALGLAI